MVVINRGGGVKPIYKKIGTTFVLFCSVAAWKSAERRRKTAKNCRKPPERRPKLVQTFIKRGRGGQRLFITTLKKQTFSYRITSLSIFMILFKCKICLIKLNKKYFWCHKMRLPLHYFISSKWAQWEVRSKIDLLPIFHSQSVLLE